METPLTFRELEAFACFGLTGFLTFNGTRVTCHEAVFAEDSLVIGIESHKSACDAETEGFGLTFVTAAVKVDMDVILFGNVKSREGLLNDVLKNRRREIYFEGAFVDGDSAVTFFEDYAGNCCFTTANCVYCFHASIISFC